MKTKINPGTAGEAVTLAIQKKPRVVLLDKDKAEELYGQVRAEADALIADVSTKRGRAAIKSMADEIALAKKSIDDAGETLNEHARKQIALVDAARRHWRARFGALAEKVRRPLTEWEHVQAELAEYVKKTTLHLQEAPRLGPDDDSGSAAEILEAVNKLEIDDEINPEDLDYLRTLKAEVVQALTESVARLREWESAAPKPVQLARCS